ncbi:MAG TPA: peptide MFS transporter [Chitinophagaceae bacterium]|nr:peptide MFS transporter [Chitinophagaceae bacterium]
MPQAATLPGAPVPTRKGHPWSLYVCFFTEMWERFGYYLMIAIFLLYLIDPVSKGGKGFDVKHAADLVGTFIALVYLTPFIGGLLADRYLGYRRSIILGGVLLALGYVGLSLPGMTAMYVSLGFIIVGNGFFKPNISTILGNIYNREDLKPKKDIAYNIFYMGINIGALASPFAAALMRNHFSWGAAFITAGVGMIIGLIWFVAGMKHLKEGDIIKPAQKEDMPMKRILGSVFVPAILAAILGWFISDILGQTIFGTRSNDAFMFACVPIVIFYAGIFIRSTKEDRRGLGALFAFFLVSIVFWVIYNQNSTGLTIWADQYTNREMPAAMEKIAKPMGIMQTVNTAPETVTKYDEYFRAQKGPDGKTLQIIGLNPYLKNLPHDKWPAKGQSLHVISPEIFQSVNPLFIILLTPLLVLLFAWMARRKREPSTPVKVSFGIIMAGLSSLLMLIAIATTMPDVYHNKASMLWLICTYGLFTVGELLVSPIGLSMVSKLAPARLTALMMGAWFLVNAIAGKVAGLMATFWDSFIDKKNYFLILVIAAAIAATVMFILSKRLAKVIHEKTGAN